MKYKVAKMSNLWKNWISHSMVNLSCFNLVRIHSAKLGIFKVEASTGTALAYNKSDVKYRIMLKPDDLSMERIDQNSKFNNLTLVLAIYCYKTLLL